MMTTPKTFLATLLLGAVINVPAAAVAQPCPDYAYNRSSTTFDETSVRALLNWYRQFDENEWHHARSAQSSMSVPIEGLMVNLGFEASDSGWKRFRREIESYNSLNEGRRTAYSQALVTVDQGAVQLMNACLNRRGLHAWAEPSHDPRRFILNVRFIPSGPTHNAYIQSVSSIPELACLEQFQPGAADSLGKVVGPATLRAICERPDSSAVDVVVNANEEVVEGSIRIPAIVRLLATEVPPVVERRDSTTVLLQSYKPRHRQGDRDFFGHGPDVSASAELRLSEDRTAVVLHLFMDARERGGNTWASGRTESVLYRAPRGFTIVRILEPAGRLDEVSYRDTDHANDIFNPRQIHRAGCPAGNSFASIICRLRRDRITNRGVVREWSFTGDTEGDDAGTQTEVRVRINPVKVLIQGRPDQQR
jgi:hypothetical protein